MASRVVEDAAGVRWEIWAVHPASVEHRADSSSAPPTTGERRRARSAGLRIASSMQDGWLAVRSGTERRRVVPIPPDWERLDDAALLALVERARIVGVPRRLIE